MSTEQDVLTLFKISIWMNMTDSSKGKEGEEGRKAKDLSAKKCVNKNWQTQKSVINVLVPHLSELFQIKRNNTTIIFSITDQEDCFCFHSTKNPIIIRKITEKCSNSNMYVRLMISKEYFPPKYCWDCGPNYIYIYL